MREDQHQGGFPDGPAEPVPPVAADAQPFDDLESRPHVLDERGHYVAMDGQAWWDGGAWVPGRPPDRALLPGIGARPSGQGSQVTWVQAIIGIVGLILFAGFAFSVCQSMPASAFAGN
jgi:hypothetical protein